jgi:hypothetical protein
METLKDLQQQYNEVSNIIKLKEQELIPFKTKQNNLSYEIWKTKLTKEILTKKDIEDIFERSGKHVWSNPYYNEHKKNNNCIQVNVGIGLKYFYLDETNKIINTYNAEDEISKKLIGKYIDMNSYEKEKIKGSLVNNVGVIENGKFIITYEKDNKKYQL